jgi:DNA repair protein RecO (recombination protein O)
VTDHPASPRELAGFSSGSPEHHGFHTASGISALATEKALALVVRFTDWSETSRIVTLWTREFGKVRALAKGGRRLKSNFESALDLLTVCSIVLVRKSSGGLDLLTEARVAQRFGSLCRDLPALYAAYYVAELLADWTGEDDPHPALFDEARQALESFGTAGVATGPRLARFEWTMLGELGYRPALDACAGCGIPVQPPGLEFSSMAGGIVCRGCQVKQRDRRAVTVETWHALHALDEPDGWRRLEAPAVRTAVRQLLNGYITYLMGRRPRLLPYLGS